VPVIVAVVAPRETVAIAVSAAALVMLALLGAIGARIGGARIGPAVLRVTFWGVIAMGMTGAIGHMLGTGI
jgi:VIT1/CCC1 family predicted Fe2+/Mn2+ transporter